MGRSIPSFRIASEIQIWKWTPLRKATNLNNTTRSLGGRLKNQSCPLPSAHDTYLKSVERDIIRFIGGGTFVFRQFAMSLHLCNYLIICCR